MKIMLSLVLALAVCVGGISAQSYCGGVPVKVVPPNEIPINTPQFINGYNNYNYNTAIIAVPIVVPATVFQYIPALYATAATAVPAVPKPAVTPSPGVGAVPEIDKIVRERVEAILKEKAGSRKGPPPLIMPGEPWAPATTPSTSTPPSGGQASSTDDGDIRQKAVQILANNCARCHTQGERVSGDVTLFTKESDKYAYTPSVSKDKILEVVSKGPKGEPPQMPPTAASKPDTALKDDEIETLKKGL